MASKDPVATPLPKQRGIVKSVLSGDTLIIQDVQANPSAPATEKQITFSALSAPRLGRNATEDRDAIPHEPFAWESREFLRKKCIGKRVLYNVEYVNPSNNREYGTVVLVDNSNEFLNTTVIAEGWAIVFKSTTGKESKRPDMPKLLELEEAARAAGKGIHGAKEVALTQPTGKVDAFALYNQLKGKQLNAVVEQVRIGTQVRATLLPSLHTVVVLLSGAQAPGFKRLPNGAQEPEPFAKESKQFVESNVQQRDALINIEGVDKQGNFFGSIEVAGRDVAEELLKGGLASFVGWSATTRGPAWVTKLKAAEKSAKDSKKRIWAHYVEKGDTGFSGVAKEFTGRVTGILNAGAILVMPEGSLTEVTVAFSSVKVPRASYPGDEADDAKLDAAAREESRAEKAWAAEAKEFLRKKLINQNVRVIQDYVRKAQKKDNVDLGEKAYYSVYFGDLNVAVSLAEQGFVKAMEYKSGDDRTADYELLLLAENKAKKSGKGWHGNPAKAPVRRVNDVTAEGNDPKTRQKQVEKSKNLLPFLERGGPHKAIVDYVFSGGRYKLSIPSQSCVISFSLSGVKVPRRGENSENDVLSNEALLWARSKLHQREVLVSVEAVDKGGNFIGELHLEKQNFGVQIVREGFAACHGPTVERMRNGKPYVDAEKAAKKEKKNIWKNYDEEAERKKAEAAAEEAAALQTTSGAEYLDVYVTEALSGDNFYIQVVNDESAQLDELVATLTQLSVDEGPMPEINVKVGDIVRAQFTEDNSWYRAKIVKNLGNDRWLVHYFDYGNSEELGTNRMRVLPVNFRALAPQAQEARLAFIKAPSLESEWGREAQAALTDLAVGRRLMAAVEYRDGPVLYLSLADEDGTHVNTSMVHNGLARLGKRLRRFSSHPLYNKLKEEETAAKAAHAGIWQYGDAPDSDDDEDEPRGAWGAKPAAKAAAPAAAAPAAAAPKKK